MMGFPGNWDCKESARNSGDRVQFLGQEDPLEKEMATHSNIVAWRISWTGAWRAADHGVAKNQTRLEWPTLNVSEEAEETCQYEKNMLLPSWQIHCLWWHIRIKLIFFCFLCHACSSLLVKQGQLLSSCPVTPAHSQLHLTPGRSLWAPEFQSVLIVCLT